MVPQTNWLASAICAFVKPSDDSRSNDGDSYNSALMPSLFSRKSSPSVQRLMTKGSSNAPGKADSTFCSASSVNPFAFNDPELTCGQPFKVPEPRL
jgi:hypothetical protein